MKYFYNEFAICQYKTIWIKQILACGLVFNDKNQPAEEYSDLDYGIVMYEYSFIDDNTLSLYSPWDDTTVEIERMK